MKTVTSISAIAVALAAIVPSAAWAGRVYTFSDSRAFSGSFEQGGYNVSSDFYGNVGYGDFGTTTNGGCAPNTDCAISTGGTASTSPTLYAASSSSSLSDVIYGMQKATSGEAHASLFTGEIGAMATGEARNCPGYSCDVSTTAIAQIGENIHFTVAGANATTHTTVGFSFDVDGTMTIDTTSFAQALLRVFPSGGNAAEFLAQVNSSGILNAGTNGVWSSYTINPSTPDHMTFTGYLDLVGATVDMGIGYSLLVKSGTGLSDYGSTGKFSFILPDNVSYTSDSGVFLTGNPNGAVPEPTSWAMMICGLGMVGAAMRRRTRVARLAI